MRKSLSIWCVEANRLDILEEWDKNRNVGLSSRYSQLWVTKNSIMDLFEM